MMRLPPRSTRTYTRFPDTNALPIFADRQPFVVARGERLQRLADGVQVRRDPLQQPLPVRGQADAARLSHQQLLAQPRLQPAPLVAERAAGEVERLGRARQVADPRGGDEALPGAQREAAQADREEGVEGQSE